MDIAKVGDKRIKSTVGEQTDRIARGILKIPAETTKITHQLNCLLYTSPSPRDS